MLPGIEGLLQRDLAQAFSDEMEKQILTGDGSGANVSGITHGVTQAANPGSATTYQQYSSLAATAVDGRWAGALSDVKIIMPVQAYVAGAALFETANTVDTASADAHAEQRGGVCQRPSAAWRDWEDDHQQLLRHPESADDHLGLLPHLGQLLCYPRPGDQSQSRGEVRLIATAYYNFNVIRADAIVALAVRIS